MSRVSGSRTGFGWPASIAEGLTNRQIAETLKVPVENVTYNVIPAGGAFGRHLFHDQEVMDAQVSQRLGKPVKLQWMREEGIKHGRCRPVSIHKVKATMVGGDVVSFEHRMACPEMDLRHGLGDVATGYVTEYNNEGVCQYFFAHTQKVFYKTGPTAITLKQRLLAKPTAAWRVVYSGQVGAVNEILIDEVARSLASASLVDNGDGDEAPEGDSDEQLESSGSGRRRRGRRGGRGRARAGGSTSFRRNRRYAFRRCCRCQSATVRS